jgi:hypothetical protein
MKPWEYNPQIDITIKRYQAFSHYRGLGPQRSLVAAFFLYKGEPQNTAKVAPKYFRKWSSDSNWVSRAEAWDKHLQEQAFAQQEKSATATLKKSLEDLDTQISKLGQIQLGLATRAASIATKELRLWEEEFQDEKRDEKTRIKTVDSDRKPRYQDAIAILKAIPMLRADGEAAWAKALHVDKLLTEMEEKAVASEGLPEGIEWTRVVADAVNVDVFEDDDE